MITKAERLLDEIKKKKVVRDGKVVKIIPPKPGFKVKDGHYVKITGAEKTSLHKSAVKAARKAKSHKAQKSRSMKKSLRIRKSRGL